MKQAKRKYLNLDSHDLPVRESARHKTRAAHFYAHPSRLDIYVWTQGAAPDGVQVGSVQLSRKVVEAWLREARQHERATKARRSTS